MALGKRKHQQQEAWVATTELPRSPGHPFYKKLNQLLAEADFDPWIETLCEPYYAERSRQHDAGGQRGDEEHRAARYG